MIFYNLQNACSMTLVPHHWILSLNTLSQTNLLTPTHSNPRIYLAGNCVIFPYKPAHRG